VKKLLTILFGLIVTFFLTGCASNQMLDDGYFYKDIGGASCQSYEVVSPKKIKCFDKDGKLTYLQDAMTDQEVIAWKMDEMNSRITSLQTQQMFNNINLNNSINQQNLYNNNNFITTCPWWDIC
jgi:outer membrane biogenesis lipoprotein LolB